MTAWQKRARIGIAIFGIAVAVVVYRSIGTRQTPARPAQVAPLDPKITSETEQGEHRQYRQTQRDFGITFDKLITYEDGSTRMINPRINVPPRSDGRSFVVTADEAQAGQNQKDKQLKGHVKLVASDGFEMTTDLATQNEDSGQVHVPGAVKFTKGRMSGSGVNGTYDQNRDVLTIAEQAAITVVDDAGHPTTDFSAGSATLDRLQHVLTMDMQVHVVRGPQVTDTDHTTARLAENNEVITHLELRGQSRVSGASAIRSMSARDIDMDYSDDGRALERVVLTGGAEIVPAREGESTRTMAAESLDVRLAPDGSILGVTGRENVRLDLPPSGDSPGGRITARDMDASGEAGRGLTEAKFTSAVEYREPPRKGTMPRVVRAESLRASLADDAITDAVFNGKVSFEEEDLRANAPEIRYQPSKNSIALTSGETPAAHVSIDQIEIDARRVDVALESRQISASQVKTTLRPQSSPGRGSTPSSNNRSMPGLLKQDAAANVNGDTLSYTSTSGKATYTGNARLFQGTTSISGDSITVDRDQGDLSATGAARSTLDLETGRVSGSGHDIRYTDANRTMTYSAEPVAPTRGRGTAPTAAASGGRGSLAPVREAQVKGPQGDLHAERIEIVLAKSENRTERLEAFTNVTLKTETRTAVGARLTYHAADERYVMSGTGAVPVTIVSTTTESGAAAPTCRQTTGRTLTFFKSTDTINVDGNEESRTETRNTPCALPTSR